MATPTYIEEFYDKFEQPQINRLTVGFSGIDPQQKTLFEAAEYDYSKLTPAQQKVIEQMIASYVSKLSIRIDSGNVDPATPEPEPPTVTLRPSEIPHEDLAGLLGGDKDGHYHLTDEQHERLTAYPAFDRLIDDIADDLEHNSLKGLQGGTNNEYYHLKRSDFEALAKLIAALLPNGQTVELPETIDNHEELVGLLGGDLSGHYHLTKGERDKLSEYPDYDDLAGDLASDIAGDVEHNALKGLQGGKSGERYHLSQEEVNKLAKLAAALMPDGQTVTLPESGTTDHELLTHLLGGAAIGHYHLTELEIQGLRKLLTALIPSGGDVELPESGTSDHEQLTSLMGGDSTGHYHMTASEHTKLDTLIDTLMPNGSDTVTLPDTGISEHEALEQLLGGNDDGHYHLTEAELERLQKVLTLLYANGGDDPEFPVYILDPDDPSHYIPYIPGEDFSGLPAATPPNWQVQSLPDGYAAFDGVHKMYYGTIPCTNANTSTQSSANSVVNNALLVMMGKNNNNANKFMIYTKDLNTWNNIPQTMAITSYGQNVGQYLYREVTINNNSGGKFLYMLGYPATGFGLSQNYQYYGGSSQGWIRRIIGTASAANNHKTSFLAGCYSPALNMFLFASQDGDIYRMQGITVIDETITCGLSDVNHDCAEWVPSGWFVVAGSEGTALSSTGAADTWVTYPDAPHNLRDMTWRENFKEGACLFAWREEDRHFYASADGITWQVAGNLPTTEQISTIAAVDYNPDLGWYCAIGGTSNYAYFSKDLHTWVETTVTKPMPIPMGSVIWMPSTKKYVLMPTSGTYYYTFSPEDWEGATDDTGA